MHGQHAAFWQQVVQHREHGLLDFTGILRARNQDETCLEIKGDHGFRARAMLGGVGLECGQAKDRELWCEGHVTICLDQEMTDEQGLPRILRDDTGLQRVRLVGTRLPAY